MPHLWRYQEFSAWMTDSMHDAGGPALTGPFRQSDYLQGVAWQAGLPMPA